MDITLNLFDKHVRLARLLEKQLNKLPESSEAYHTKLKELRNQYILIEKILEDEQENND